MSQGARSDASRDARQDRGPDLLPGQESRPAPNPAAPRRHPRALTATLQPAGKTQVTSKQKCLFAFGGREDAACGVAG